MDEREGQPTPKVPLDEQLPKIRKDTLRDLDLGDPDGIGRPGLKGGKPPELKSLGLPRSIF